MHEININFNDIATLKNNRSGEDNEKRILIYELINNVRQKNRELLSGTTNKIQANFRNQQMVIYEHIKMFIILNVFILMLGIFLSVFTSRSISRPIEKLNDVENIIRSMFDSLVVATPEGTILTVNKAVCDMLGYRSEEIVGQPIDKLFYQETTQSKSTWLNESLKKGSIINLEKTYLAKDGRKIPVLFSMSTMCDDKGYISGIVIVAKDITERKRTEDLLKKSKEFAETTLNSMKDAISVIDANNFRIIDVNSVFLTNYRMKKEEVIGKTCYEITHRRAQPCIPPDDICPLIGTLNTGEHSTAEHVHYMKDGEKRYIEVSTSPIMDETGKINKVIHVARDITEHKQMEDTLRRNEEHFRSVTENVMDIITVMDTYGKISYISPSVERVLGYKHEELIGKNAFELIHPEDIAGVMDAINKGIQNPGSGQLEEYRFKRKDGSWGVLESMGKIIIDNAGTSEIIVNSRDITDRKQAEEARLIIERKYATLVEQGNDGIIIIEDGLLKFINSKMVSIAGFPVTESIEKPFIDFVAMEFREFVIDNYKKRSSGQEALNNYEIEIISKDGKNIPVEINASIIDYEGKWAEMAIIRDITERKKTERQIEASLNEKETLLKEIHHRVKNNMQIVSSLLDHQIQYIKDKNVIDIFTESQNRIASMSLVHEKLYRSKDLAKIDFYEYINDLVANLFQSYNSNSGNILLNMNIENIQLDIDFAIPCGLIINELVTNSLKYAFPAGRKGEIKVSFFKTDENMLELVIGDNGIGISKDLDFRKTESLGLHLVTILAENQLHGEINLILKGGTEFHIKFRGIK